MLKTNNPFVNYLIFLIPAISLTAGIHFFILKQLKFSVFDNKIVLSYIVNTTLVILIYLGLYILNKMKEQNLGFIFMIGSFIKFGLFFLLFYPDYKSDGTIQTLEFTTFFIPYAVCLTIETYYLTKLLNKN